MRLLFLTLLIAATIRSSAQNSNPFGETISQEKLLEDLDVLIGSLKEAHPGLYLYRSAQEIDSNFQQAKRSINEPLNLIEFYRIVLPAISYIGCGHTYADLPTEADQFIMSGKHFFPLGIRIIDGRLFYVPQNRLAKVEIQSGAEIISINNHSASSIIEKGLNAYWQDGLGQSGKQYKLEQYFEYFYAYFIEQPQSFQISYIDAQNQPKQTTINALTLEEIKKSKTSNQPNRIKNLTLEYLSDSTVGLLTIKQFFGWNENGKHFSYNDELQKIFNSLNNAKTEQLIIDIRNNGGGMQPWRLTAYLQDNTTQYAKEARFIYKKGSEFSSYQKLDPNIKWIKNRGMYCILPGSNKMRKLNDSTFNLTGLYVTKLFKPLTPTFDGEVYTLVNGGTFSAASWFAAIAKSNNRSTIIGQETAGGYFGQTSMAPMRVTLPNTKLIVHIPLVNYIHNVDADRNKINRGIIPDHLVEYSLEDYVKQSDKEMEKALELINEQ